MTRKCLLTVLGLVLCAPARAEACSLRTEWSPFHRARTVELWLVPLADTMSAGVWQDAPFRAPWTTTNQGTAPMPLFGQLARVEHSRDDSGVLPGDAIARAGGKVLLIPYGYAADCSRRPWPGSVRWMPPGENALFLGQPRPVTEWINGIPTFDVLGWHDPYPFAQILKREARRSPKDEPWLTVPEYWTLRSLFPRDTASADVKARAKIELESWAREHPTLARRFPADVILGAARR